MRNVCLCLHCTSCREAHHCAESESPSLNMQQTAGPGRTSCAAADATPCISVESSAKRWAASEKLARCVLPKPGQGVFWGEGGSWADRQSLAPDRARAPSNREGHAGVAWVTIESVAMASIPWTWAACGASPCLEPGSGPTPRPNRGPLPTPPPPLPTLQAYWPFHRLHCKRNEFADAMEEADPKFASWMRGHGKMAVLKDDEVDRLERATQAASGPGRHEVMESMYGRLDPKPQGDPGAVRVAAPGCGWGPGAMPRVLFV